MTTTMGRRTGNTIYIKLKHKYLSRHLPPHFPADSIRLDDERLVKLRERSYIKKWIKLIPHDKTIPIEDFEKGKEFVHLANIVKDDEVFASGERQGKKKRTTLIELKSVVDDALLKQKSEWLYMIVVNGRITKIGGTRNSICGRFGSYICGHHIEERGKSGKASETNKYIYNTLYFYLNMGCDVKLFGYKLPEEEITRNVFGHDVKIRVQTYHSYESILIDEFRKQCGFIPFLCDNSDPDYKSSYA